METQIIKHAAIQRKKGGGVEVKIWFTDMPVCTVPNIYEDDIDLKLWYKTGNIYQFKDDLQAGKFMWLSAHIHKQLNPNGGGDYYNALISTGVFITPAYINLIILEDDKIYMKPIPDPPKEIKFEFTPQSVTPEERLTDISRKQKVQKTITVTGKTLWNYAWVGAAIGLVIGVAWGLVLGAVYF